MFFGAAVMVALVADGDDDAGLIVLPAMGGDAGALAQLRARAIGGDQKACLDRRCRRRASRSTPSARESIAETAVAREIDAFGLGAGDQRVDQMAVLDHMRERFAGLDIAGKRQEHRTGGVFQSWNR